MPTALLDRLTHRSRKKEGDNALSPLHTMSAKASLSRVSEITLVWHLRGRKLPVNWIFPGRKMDPKTAKSSYFRILSKVYLP